MEQSILKPAAQSIVPGPRGSLVLGNLAEFTGDLLGLMQRDFATYGDIVRYRVGSRNVYILSHPDLAEYVLIKHQRDFPKPKGTKGLGVVVGNGLIANEGESWLLQRRMMQPMFHRQRLAAMADTMTAAGKRMLDRWATLPNNQPVNIAAEMLQVTLDIIMQTMFSTDVLSEAQRIGAAVSTLLKFATYKIRNPWSLPISWPTRRNKGYAEANRTIDGMIYRLINERRNGQRPQGDLLDMLLEARDADTGEQMSDRQIRDEVLTIFAAGHETTANTLAFAWYALSQTPHVRTQLHAELDTVLKGRQPVVGDLPNLPFTKHVFEEAMRLYPAAPIIGSRIAMREATLNGYTIPAKSWVITSIYNIHRHPSLWENPTIFDPERFSPQRSEGRHPLAFMPFGIGPRKCIGNHMAEMEGMLLLAMIAQRYALEHLAAHEVSPELAITLRPQTGIPMLVRERTMAL